MSRRLLTGLLFAAGLAVLIGPPTVGQEPGATPDPKAPPAAKDAKPGDPGDSDDPMKKFPEFAKVVKGAKVQEGLFTLHQKDDNVYAEVRPDQFDKPFLVPIAVAKGAGMGGYTLNFGEEWAIVLKKVGDKVFVVRRNVRFTAKPGSPEAKAVDTTYSDSVLLSIPVKTMNPMKGTTVIDLNDIFFGDFADLGIGFPDRSRTTWHQVKAFKKNVELQVSATFSGGRFGRMFFGGDDVIDSRGITLVIQYGIVELPDGGYQPRYADNRVGHFLTVQKDFSKATPDTSFVRMVNRWRLERADGAPYKEGMRPAPPKKRIVFWIEDSVPDEYRTAVREGILEWNKAFEKIGFKDAIEVRQQDGQEFDPEDVTYATFRWITSDSPFAMGPSRANPLTGELLDADIIFDGSMVQYYKQESRLFRDDKGRPVEPASMIQALHKGWDQPMHPLALRGSPFSWNDKPGEPPMSPEARQWQRMNAASSGYCRCAAHKRSELTLAVLHLAAAVGLKDSEKVPDELIQQAVKEVTMHEVGHTLGLRHNFKASTMLANDKLNDTSITRKVGQVGSVMDYNPANIAPKGTKQGDFFTTTIGPYDYWAIEYAYKPVSGGPDGERDALKKIASKAPTPELVYGTDEDLYGSPDPLINLFDLGADPMRYGMDRIKLAQDLFAKLPDRVIEKGEGYSRLRQAFTILLYQYGDAAYLASRYVGGVNVNRDFKGDPNGRDPMVPVNPERQREALRFCQENILTDKPFQFPPELLRKLAMEKWYHWGTQMYFGGGVDYPVNERVLAIQEVVLDELLDGGTLSRIQNAARTAGKDEKPLTVAEVFRALTDGIFADLPGPDAKAASGAKSSVVLRNLQRAYLARLSRMVVGPKSDPYASYYIVYGGSRSVPADAKSLARLHLKEVGKRVDAALDGERDDTVRAHLEETKERIAKVLSASVTANEP